MSVLEDYAQIRGLMDSAIGKALGDEVASGLREKIQQKAHEKVYSYPATPSAMYKRRMEDGGLIAEGNLAASVSGLTLSMENTSEPQHAGGAALTPVVEEGWSNWHQPGPRPFMDEARDAYVDSGEAESAIAAALAAAGFTVS